MSTLMAGLVSVGTLPAATLAAADGVKVPIASGARRSLALPAGDKIELTLEQTISFALQNALDLDVTSLGYERAGFSLAAADGSFDPFVQLDASAARRQDPVVSTTQASDTKTQQANLTFGGLLDTGATYQAQFTNRRTDSAVTGFTIANPNYLTGLTLQLTQPLLRNFGKGVTRRFIVLSRIARDQAAYDFVTSVQSAIQTVENAYWDLAYAQENLAARREALDRAKDVNRITKIKIDVGALAPIDIVQTDVTIAQREQDIIQAEGAIGDAQDRLKRIMNVSNGIDWNRPVVAVDRPSDQSIEVDLEGGIRRALQARPEVKQAVVDIESKKVSLSYSRNQLLPKLDVTGSYGVSGLGTRGLIDVDNDPSTPPRQFDYVDSLYDLRSRNYPSWSVGVSVNVPIFNRAARGNAAVAATDLELSRVRLAILKQNIQVEVRAAARGLDTASRSILAARKSRELAERNLDAERKKYENGMTTSFQVSQIQNDLTTARTAELLAIAGYRKAVTQWHKAVGDLLTEKGITLEGLPVTLDPTPAEEGALR